MTLPLGKIAYSDVNTETGAPATRSIGMNWIHDNTKANQRANNLANVRGKTWYKKTNEGNCNNGNCNCKKDDRGGAFAALMLGGMFGNCKASQCYNCTAAQCVNCANCDNRPWLQTNCNCACTYNCKAVGIINNCDCNCDCNCNCNCDCGGNTCFLAGTQVFLANGSTKAIEEVRIGNSVIGKNRSINRVIGLWQPKLGNRSMFALNGGRVVTTSDHLLWTDDGWAAIDLMAYEARKHQRVNLIGGVQASLSEVETVRQLTTSSTLCLFTGEAEPVEHIEEIKHLDSDTQLYTLATDGTFSFALGSGIVVDGLPQRSQS
jgi:hypothetical protein